MAHDLPTTGIRSYGYQRNPAHQHQGIDLPAREGTPVYAAAAGTVTHAVHQYTDEWSGYGKAIAIAANDGTHHLYAHLADVGVQPGQRVEAGQAIGTVGRTGYTTDDPTRLISGAHLHFEVASRRYPLRKEMHRVDPVAYLLRGHVHPLKAYRFNPSGGSTPTDPTDRPGDPSAPPSSSGPLQSAPVPNIQLDRHLGRGIAIAVAFVVGVAVVVNLR